MTVQGLRQVKIVYESRNWKYALSRLSICLLFAARSVFQMVPRNLEVPRTSAVPSADGRGTAPRLHGRGRARNLSLFFRTSADVRLVGPIFKKYFKGVVGCKELQTYRCKELQKFFCCFLGLLLRSYKKFGSNFWVADKELQIFFF